MPAAARTEENRARPQTLRTAITSHLERLAGEVDATRRDAGFLQALGTMSRFWRYSLLNQNFIRVQRPGAPCSRERLPHRAPVGPHGHAARSGQRQQGLRRGDAHRPGGTRELARSTEGTPEDVEKLGGGWTAEEAVAIAIYCALKAKDFAHGVRLAVNHSGDSDSTGSMAGSLLGLLCGEEAIPKAWLDRLELRKVIAELAEDFWRHFGMEPRPRCDGEPGCGMRGKYPGS